MMSLAVVRAQTATLANKIVKVCSSQEQIIQNSYLYNLCLFQDLTCWAEGQCNGSLLDELDSPSSEHCLEACKSDGTCEWFTFDSYGSICYLFEDCPFFQTDCTTCLTGQKLCTKNMGRLINTNPELSCTKLLLIPYV